jgi:hypothetical protein
MTPWAKARWEQPCHAASIHVAANGLQWGTPRTEQDDPRFDTSALPADAFAPNAAAVWAVLDRLTWFTYDDALVLERAALRFFDGRSREDGWAHSNDAYHCAQAAKAAGGHRYTDWECIDAIVDDTCDLIRPQRCAVGPNAAGPAAFTADSALWCDVVASCATTAAWAVLVVDQVDAGPFTRTAYRWMTGPWVTAFGDPTTATTIPPPDAADPPTRPRATDPGRARSR